MITEINHRQAFKTTDWWTTRLSSNNIFPPQQSSE